MNEKILKVKNKLLELGYQDNKYLEDYIELIIKNLDTPRDSLRTQAHHVIPTKDFADNNKHYKVKGVGHRWHRDITKAELDAANFRVNLLYKDHLCAHNLLALCRNLDQIQENYEEYCYNKKLERTSLGGNYNVQMPKYITEEKILEKIDYYTKLCEQAPDERTAHKYRTSLARWRSKHRQFLEDPEKYNPANKPQVKRYTKNEALHLVAEQKRVLKRHINTARAEFKELRDQFEVIRKRFGKFQCTLEEYVALDTAVESARANWKHAVAEYKAFCEECR